MIAFLPARFLRLPQLRQRFHLDWEGIHGAAHRTRVRQSGERCDRRWRAKVRVTRRRAGKLAAIVPPRATSYAASTPTFVQTMTTDIDIAVAPDADNNRRWLAALAELRDGAAAEMFGEEGPFASARASTTGGAGASARSMETTMNCKPGDLAIVVGASRFAGRLVEV